MKTWFTENFLKANTDECHLIPVDIEISNIKITSESKVLGIYVVNRMNFDYQVSQLFKKAIKI